jgi:hypothetical protein
MKNKIFEARFFTAFFIIFSCFVFWFAYRFGQNSSKLTESQKLIYPGLLTIALAFGGWFIKEINDLTGKIDAKIQEESDKKAESKSNIFLNTILKNLENFKRQLEDLKDMLGEQVYQEVIDLLNKVVTTYDKYSERRQAADEIVNWLGRKKNYISFVREIVSATQNQQEYKVLDDELLTLFYKDIGECVRWLIDSINLLEEQPLDNYNSMTQALSLDLRDGVRIYRYALELIKAQGKPKEISGKTGVIEDYVDYLIQQLKLH